MSRTLSLTWRTGHSQGSRAKDRVTGLITQNVDGLHQAAGSKRVLELHGSLAAVRCLGCGAVSSRRQLQDKLRELNPELNFRPLELAPDGDAELREELEATFRVPPCRLLRRRPQTRRGVFR